MADKPNFEIPDAMRDMAEQQVEQARGAYSQFLQVAKQAQDVVAKSSEAMTDSAREIQTRAMRYAQENMDASFTFATDLARARDPKEWMEIQTRFAQRQMQNFAQQSQDLGRLVSDAAQKVQRR